MFARAFFGRSSRVVLSGKRLIAKPHTGTRWWSVLSATTRRVSQKPWLSSVSTGVCACSKVCACGAHKITQGQRTNASSNKNICHFLYSLFKLYSNLAWEEMEERQFLREKFDFDFENFELECVGGDTLMCKLTIFFMCDLVFIIGGKLYWKGGGGNYVHHCRFPYPRDLIIRLCWHNDIHWHILSMKQTRILYL